MKNDTAHNFPEHLSRPSKLLAALFMGIIFPLLTVLAGCQKDPLHENLVIGGNTPPPFDGISTVQMQTYVNKLHIDLLGRGPTVSELDDMVQLIRDSEFDEFAVQARIETMQNSYEWSKNYDVLTKGRFLNGSDSFAIQEQIDDYQVSIDYYISIGDPVTATLLAKIQQDLVFVQEAGRKLWTGFIDFNEYHRRHIMNPIYDEINMGSENYVLACFENLYFREPTESELEQAILMVDAIGGFLFLENGDSKRDFAEIAVHADPYYEGLVFELFTLLLARNPDSQEMAQYSEVIRSTGDYRALQRQILTGLEYAGF